MNVSAFFKPAAATAALVAALVSVNNAQAAYRSIVVDGDASRFFSYNASYGERFRVVISGDGDSDLDLIVRDSDGDVVCRAVGPTDDEACNIFARYGGRYRIEIKNLGMPNRTELWVL